MPRLHAAARALKIMKAALWARNARPASAVAGGVANANAVRANVGPPGKVGRSARRVANAARALKAVKNLVRTAANGVATVGTEANVGNVGNVEVAVDAAVGDGATARSGSRASRS